MFQGNRVCAWLKGDKYTKGVGSYENHREKLSENLRGRGEKENNKGDMAILVKNGRQMGFDGCSDDNKECL